MKSGDRITRKGNNGTFIGLIRHTYRWRGKQLAMVHFDGKERMSRVPAAELAFAADPPTAAQNEKSVETTAGG